MRSRHLKSGSSHIYAGVSFELVLRSCGACAWIVRPSVLTADQSFLETRTLIQVPDAEPIGGETRLHDLLSIRNIFSRCVLMHSPDRLLSVGM